MKLKKKIVFFIVCITILLMSTALAAYMNNLDIESKGTVGTNQVDSYFELAYEILDKNTILEETYYIIEFTLFYYGTQPAQFWDLSFLIPDDTEILDIENADYEITNSVITLSNLSNSLALNNEDSIEILLTFKTSDPNFEPDEFSMTDIEIEKISRPRLIGELELVSSSENTYIYYLIITNNGNVPAVNWKVYIKINNSFEFISILPHLNFIQQTETLILSNPTDEHEINPEEKLIFTLTYNTNRVDFIPEIININNW